MPMRTRSPSCLAHSCSRVYRSSFGTLAMVSPRSAGLLHPGRLERRACDPSRLALAADLDLERGADRRQRRLDVGNADVLVDGRSIRARGDDPRLAAVVLDRVPVARHRLVDHLDTDQSSTHALGADLLEREAPDEVSLGRLGDPAQAGLERVCGFLATVVA